MNKHLLMRYFSPAERTTDGWEKYSLPIGNGYFGASVFGGADIERIQFTTNTFANPYNLGGVTNFGEVFVEFNHHDIRNYERGLSLNNGVAYSKYIVNDILVNRECFASYPDKVFAYKIQTQNGNIDFNVKLVIPYLNERALDDGGRTGEVKVENDTLVMRGTLPSRELVYEARLAVETDGEIITSGDSLSVKDLTYAVLFYTLDTSYKLCPEVFMEGNHNAMGDDPNKSVKKCLANAIKLGWDKLYKRHIEDYGELINRVELDLGGADDGRSTEELLLSYKDGNNEPYLEEIYFAYGRYLLVSSSREGTPPASLQGVWTVHDKSPWSCGFWHNINVQMNYWPAFSTNLAETFKAYADYWKNYQKAAGVHASDWIKDVAPQNYVEGDGECGWIIGTGAWMYQIEAMSKNTHSGPGTGGMTSKMFWDYYDFTRDKNVLKEYSYPAIHGMAKFLTKCVKEYDGRYLCSFSASPEQILSGSWVHQHKKQQYWHTVGCAFDQQFIYENAVDDLKCSEILGESDSTTQLEKEQISGYGPVQIGYSGQIKEYDEEHFYGEIGEAKHRHISQLVALMPGSAVTHKTPAWIDAARLTLQMRGDKSSGWALAHRLNAWARVGDGNHAYLLLQNLLRERTYPNLWDVHPPFQIDGNFGATAGIAEMVLQSHEGYISLLPSIPDAWKKISFKGLKARGNFTVDCDYLDGKIQHCKIVSESGGTLNLSCEGIEQIKIMCNGKTVDYTFDGSVITFETQKGDVYNFDNVIFCKKRDMVANLVSQYSEDGVKLLWQYDKPCEYAVYRAKDNDSDYKLLAVTDKCEYTDAEYSIKNKARLTYKVVVVGKNGYNSSADGAIATMHPASALEEEKYNLLFRVVNKLD